MSGGLSVTGTCNGGALYYEDLDSDTVSGLYWLTLDEYFDWRATCYGKGDNDIDYEFRWLYHVYQLFRYREEGREYFCIDVACIRVLDLILGR